MLQVSSVPAFGLVEYRLAGFLDLADVAELDRQTRAHVAQTIAACGYYVELVDVSEFAIQSFEVAEAMKAIRNGLPVSRRAAIVTGNSPARLQAKRLKARATCLFQTRAEAMAWLVGARAQENEAA